MPKTGRGTSLGEMIDAVPLSLSQAHVLTMVGNGCPLNAEQRETAEALIVQLRLSGGLDAEVARVWMNWIAASARL